MQIAFIDKLALSLLWDAFQQNRMEICHGCRTRISALKKNIVYHLGRESEKYSHLMRRPSFML